MGKLLTDATAGELQAMLRDRHAQLDAASGRGPADLGGDTLPAPATLYQCLAVREYDEDGVLVAAGSETGTTPETIDTGHSLQWTPDWLRFHA